MKAKYSIAGVGFLIAILTAVSFQNCASPKESEVAAIQQTSSGEVFVAMAPATAQSMAMGYEGPGGCSGMSPMSSNYSLLGANSSLVASTVHEHRATTLSSISGSGVVTIFGTGVNPGVNFISNFGGNLLLCGFGAGAVEGGNGNLVFQNSSLSSVKNFKGNIILLGGSLPAEIQGFTGNIVVKNTAGQYSGRSYSAAKKRQLFSLKLKIIPSSQS